MNEVSDQTKQRLEKLNKIKEKGYPYPNDFHPLSTTQEILTKYESSDRSALENVKDVYRIAGRILQLRSFGKTAFMPLQDRTGRLQIYVAQDILGEKPFQEVMSVLDAGDIVGVEGTPFRTKTNELTLKVSSFRILSKCLHPLPEKWHGLTDIEIRYRQRYLDLIVNPDIKKVFQTRIKMIHFIRQYFTERNYLEVETPMMQPIAGGALARPFVTHHNTLDMDLYLRIAPELYLKRLLVGGFERVFELNRNFRNEGISIQHNPEFTMLEFYEAYATYEDYMNLIEDLFSSLVKEVLHTEKVTYQDQEISFKRPWARYTIREAILKFTDLKEKDLSDSQKLISFLERQKKNIPDQKDLGHLLPAVLEECVEHHLIQPTFILQYPLAVSPLSRKNEKDPLYTDRFELYIYGRELANAFSELNDPLDQKERFLKQVQERKTGNEESHAMDEDYVRALEYGMPPAAGGGIGIDRLVMLLTNSPSIRDVILFPQLRQ